MKYDSRAVRGMEWVLVMTDIVLYRHIFHEWKIRPNKKLGEIPLLKNPLCITF